MNIPNHSYEDLAKQTRDLATRAEGQEVYASTAAAMQLEVTKLDIAIGLAAPRDPENAGKYAALLRTNRKTDTKLDGIYNTRMRGMCKLLTGNDTLPGEGQ